MRLLRAGRGVLRWQGWLKTPTRQISLSSSLLAPDFSWDYEHERKNFNLVAPEYYNFARDVVDKWAKKEQTGERGDNPALWWINESGQEKKFSFQDISYQSKLVANVLRGPCGLKEGDIAIIMLPRVPEWWFVNVAAIRAGVVLSSATTLLRASDIKYRLNVSGAKCLITNPGLAEAVDEVADLCPSLKTKVIVGHEGKRSGWLSYEDLLAKSTDHFECVNSRSCDPMTIFFTSGTTGSPKMTEHTHSSYGLGHAITAKYWHCLTPQDVLWNLSDTGWAKCAWGSLFSPWIAGACSFVQDSPKFDPQATLQVLRDYPVSHFCSAPTGMRFLVKEDLRQYRFTSLAHCLSAGEPVVLSSYPISVFCCLATMLRMMQTNEGFAQFRGSAPHLQHVVSGGEAVNPELLQEWTEGTGLPLYEGYGQTETTLLCATYPSIKQRPGSMGKPAPGINLQIVDDEGQVVPAGQEGNIAVRYRPTRPVGLFSRYIADEEKMRTSFVGDFFLTGDRAAMDEEGYIWFKCRADDVILSSGYRIGPFEVESALLEHPAVLESAVVSSPDKYRGEIVKAFITLTAGYLEADKEALVRELQKHSKAVTAPYKYPRQIEFIEALPKTISGKIRRVELREKEWAKQTS